MVRMEFIVLLSTGETNEATGLDTLGIVISLTRWVGRTNVEIKTNILELTMQHAYFINWTCLYFILF